MTLQKTHQYKIFSPTGTYLGLLPSVVSQFQYNQTIASSFVQTQITVQQSADVSILPTTPILDEYGNALLDEAGNQILDEGVNDIVGSNNPNNLIACNNQIQIYEYSSFYPNGLLVFTGYISKWKAVFGGADNIILTCISNGQDLGQYLVQGAQVQDQSQTTGNVQVGSLQSYNDGHGTHNVIQSAGQTVTPGGGVTNVAAILVKLACSVSVTWTINIYNSVTDANNGATPLGTVSQTINNGGVATDYKFTFTSPVTVGSSYFFTVVPNVISNSVLIYISSSDLYAGGSYYYNSITGGLDPNEVFSWATISSEDLYFKTYYTANTLNNSYSAQDTAFVWNDVLTNYISGGGGCSLQSGGYANTGNFMTYTFKIQTILQAIQTIMNFSPATQYWYVDPATNQVIYKTANTTADILLIKGRHINELELEATRENIKNNAYFSGGDDGTGTSTNIFVNVTAALAGNRVGLSLLSDNRVNSTSGGKPTARVIAQNNLNVNASETYITSVVVQDPTIDTNLIKLGMMIGFANFSPFVNNLLLQVVGINKQPDQVVLQLGTLPIRDTQAVATAQAQLAALQTVANPNTAS